jgi:hypothetical protein
VMTIVALGLASATIVHKFMDDVVFATVRMKEPFSVAHELLICYFREIDFDPARVLHMGNVFAEVVRTPCSRRRAATQLPFFVRAGRTRSSTEPRTRATGSPRTT